VLSEPHVVFRNTDPGPGYGHVAIVPLADPRGPRVVTGLSCDRIAMTGDVGVCATTEIGSFAGYLAKVVDRRFRVRDEVPLPGPPSRVRVAPNGSWASVTDFVTGDSYADANFRRARASSIRLPAKTSATSNSSA
jgi:hypothetical protein